MTARRRAPPSAAGASGPPWDGGCACGALRYRIAREPLFVHCCHCTRCQRETGSPFAHHALVEYSAMSLLAGEPELVQVPTDSGNRHWVARCPACRTALWNEHGSRAAITRYVRVGTLDAPAAHPPRAHIFVRSKQPWLALDPATPSHRGHYDAAKVWPAASVARWNAAKAERAATRSVARPAARRKKRG